MSTDLGKAYVQIMPSAQGITGSIQKTLDPEATAAGKSAGTRLATSIADAMGNIGGKLTKSITMPVMGAATAIGGLVGALGFKRLVGMDTAQAKLKGLGIEGKQLEVVMENAKAAVQGTTHTMADGADVAAGALAAGVKEGADLERYIKLVGDAATGSNAPMGEMAQIFNRIQGSGKIMGNELDMIEHRMPGFSQAVAKNLGVAPEEMRKMVSAGKVSTDDFLNTMESFAGGMSEAYASTWSGLKANVMSNIGIIGEALMEGLFEDGKQGMAEFLDFLRNSEGLKQWATETGEKMREVFNNIVDAVKNVIEWWGNLNEGMKELFTTIGGVLVVIGPLLLIGQKIITGAMTVWQWFGKIKLAIDVLIGAITALSAPVLITIGVIAGLIAVFVALYKHNEQFREIVHQVWEVVKQTIMTVVQAVSDFVMDIFGGLVAWWKENNELIKQTIDTVWQAIQTVIMGALNIIVPLLKTAWEGIKNNIQAVWGLIKSIIETQINLIKGVITTVMQIITGDWSGAWNTIKSTVSNLLSGIVSIISNLLNTAFTVISGILNNVKSTFTSIFNGLVGIVTGALSNVTGALSSGMQSALSAVTNFFGKFKDAGKKIVTSIADGIKGAVGKVTGAISNVAGKIRDFLPFSPPKTGPLIDIMDVKWGETIAGGIDKGESAVANAMDSLLDFDLTKRASFSGYGGSSNPLLDATLKQNQLLTMILDKDPTIKVSKKDFVDVMNQENALNSMTNYF